MRNGHGKYVWARGRTYEGEFADGNFNGYGKLTDYKGIISFEGEWEKGMRKRKRLLKND